jgi:hypothetical protein
MKVCLKRIDVVSSPKMGEDYNRKVGMVMISKRKKILRNAFEFFNCDETKSANSMNPLYETCMYRDVRQSRRRLWERIKNELDKKNIEIAENDWSAVRKCVLFGNPSDANDMIKYGIILTKTMEDY